MSISDLVKCPECGRSVSMRDRDADSYERHGLEAGPYEHFHDKWYECPVCQARFTEQEFKEMEMPNPVTADRAVTLLGIAGREFNDEFTVILTAVFEALGQVERDHPARPYLEDVKEATQRCCRKVTAMLAYAKRHGARQVAGSLERIIARETA